MVRDVLKKCATPFVALVLLTACNQTAPVREIGPEPISPPAASMDVVQKAILKAGAGLNWQMKQVGPGRIEGTLKLRVQTAVVDITYGTKNFGIRYKDSSELKYDGTNIHRNYNSWVDNLARQIRVNLVQ